MAASLVVSFPERALDASDRAFVAHAAGYLESGGFWVRVADVTGRPVGQALGRVPARVRTAVAKAVSRSLELGIDWVTSGVTEPVRAVGDVAAAARVARAGGHRHAAVTAATGAVGGLLGASTLVVELPVTTLVMLRSISRVAVAMGADLEDPATRLECLSVLSLGGSSRGADAGDSAYLATRVALAGAMQNVARRLASPGARGGLASPAIARLLAAIAARFEIAVTEKAVAQALPILGAVGGAIVNATFAHHYNSLALYHFGLKQLERRAGADRVQALYRAEVAKLGRPGASRIASAR